MEQRRLGRSGLTVSRLALGTMTWGRDTDEHEAGDQLRAFLEAGGTLLDTAAGYGDGESERVIGGLLGSVVDRSEVVLATKAGISRRTGERVVDTSRRALLDALDGSLQRLGTDHVDLWQVHAWSDDTELPETLSAVDHAVATGRARYAGISNYSGWQTGRAVTWQQAGAGPGAAGVDPDGVLPAAARHRARGAAGGAGARARSAAVVAARARGCSPASTASGTPSDSRAASPHFARFIERFLDDRSRGIVDAVCTAADGLDASPAGGGAGLGA